MLAMILNYFVAGIHRNKYQNCQSFVRA